MDLFIAKGGERIRLRPDQEPAAEEAYQYILQGKNIQLIAPPGFGKTTLAVALAVHAIEERGGGEGGRPRVVVLTETNRLAEDIYRRIDCAAGGFCFGHMPHRVVLMEGRRNVQCPVHGVPASQAPCWELGVVDRLINYRCYLGPSASPRLPSKYIGIANRYVYYRKPKDVSSACPY
ncbi:MAG: DEAD/DEAH box helicase, partial [Thermoproteus sp.]